MRKIWGTPMLAALALGLSLTLTGCAGESDEPSAAAPDRAEQVLAEHDLAGMDTAEVIDHLDRLGGDDRPTDLMASVRPGELVLTSGDDEVSLAVADDQFYLSVAPYVDETHECFNHSLTTCQGELSDAEIEVEVVDADGKVLMAETRTTFANGFTGLWLPRDIEATLRVSYDGRSGEAEVATGPDDPTCLTTLQLT